MLSPRTSMLRSWHEAGTVRQDQLQGLPEPAEVASSIQWLRYLATGLPWCEFILTLLSVESDPLKTVEA